MADSCHIPAIQRKPLPNRSMAVNENSGQAQSSLYRTWSSHLTPLQDYERSLSKFPWLRNPKTPAETSQNQGAECDHLVFSNEETAISQDTPQNDTARLLQGPSEQLFNRDHNGEKNEPRNRNLVRLELMLCIY